MHAGLGEHRVVLNLGLAQGLAVVRDDDELGLAGAERLEGRLVTERVLAGTHHNLKTVVDALVGLALLLGNLHFGGGGGGHGI